MARRVRLARLDPWSLGALAIAVLVLLPIVSVLWLAAFPKENIWGHLIATTLPRYMGNTAVLMVSVGALSAAVGTGAAWLISVYRFPLSRWLEWLLLLPLGLPAYVGAYALVDFLEYAGPVQTGLRNLFGWSSARDYWFPEIRSMGAAILVLSAALYPYVYLMARTAFRDMPATSFDMARVLGAGALARFWRVALPLARPGIVAGMAIVMMETVNDFGVVDYFAVQTLTTGIFSVWLEGGNAGGAAQIATVILVVIVVLSLGERHSRRHARFYATQRPSRRIEPTPLPLGWGLLATLACLLPFVMGFVLPAGVMLSHTLKADAVMAPGLGRALANTVFVGGVAALVTVLGALFLVYGVRLARAGLARQLLPLTTIGYAAPGAVLGVGLLIPMATADHALADWVEAISGYDPGLIMTGSAFAVIFAYMVRFFAIAQGAIDSAMGRIAPSAPMAARSLGRTAGGTLRDVYVPLVRGSVGTALLLVFVDCVKELPATLLLRPFGFNTLATRVYEKASLENIEDASPAALLVVGVGVIAVLLLARANLSTPRSGPRS